MARNTQISLFNEDDSLREIKKHSSIAQVSNLATMQGRKAMNVLIWIAKDMLKRNPHETTFTCDIWIIKRLAWLADNDNKELKATLRSLADLKMEYNIFNKEKKERGIFSFLAWAKIEEWGRWKPCTVTFEFPSLVLDVIKNPNMYVRLNLLVIRWLNSKHSIALYEFLRDYINLPSFRCATADFRRLMGIKPHQYKVFTSLRVKVIDVAVKEINEKTDIAVSYELERAGRKITAIIFTMDMKKEKVSWADASSLVKEKLQTYNIKPKTIEQLLAKHDEQYLLANIAIVEERIAKGENIPNPSGYIMQSFKVDYRPKKTEYDKLQEEKAKEEEEQKLQKEQEQQAAEQWLTDFERWKKEQISQRLSRLPEDRKSELQEKFIESIQHNTIFKTHFDAKGFEDGAIQIRWIRFLGTYLLSDQENTIDYFKAEKRGVVSIATS